MFCFVFETESSSVAQASPKFKTSLPCFQDYRYVHHALGVIRAYLFRYGHYCIPSKVCRKTRAEERRHGLVSRPPESWRCSSGCRVVTLQLTEPPGTGKRESELNHIFPSNTSLINSACLLKLETTPSHLPLTSQKRPHQKFFCFSVGSRIA